MSIVLMNNLINICETENFIITNNEMHNLGTFCYNNLTKSFFLKGNQTEDNKDIDYYYNFSEKIHLFSERIIIKNYLNLITHLLPTDVAKTFIIIPDKMPEWSICYLNLNLRKLNGKFILVRKKFITKIFESDNSDFWEETKRLVKLKKDFNFQYRFSGSIGVFWSEKWIEFIPENFEVPLSKYLTIKIPAHIDLHEPLSLKFYFKSNLIDYIELTNFIYDISDSKYDIYLNIEVTITNTYIGFIKIFNKSSYDKPIFYDEFYYPNLIYTM